MYLLLKKNDKYLFKRSLRFQFNLAATDSILAATNFKL